MRRNICKVVSILTVLLMIALFYPSIGLSGPIQYLENYNFPYSYFWENENVSSLGRGWGNSWGAFMESNVEAVWEPGEETDAIFNSLFLNFTSTSQVRVNISIDADSWDPYLPTHNWPVGIYDGSIGVEGAYPYYHMFERYEWGFDEILGPGTFYISLFGGSGAYGSDGGYARFNIIFDIVQFPFLNPPPCSFLGLGCLAL